MPVYEYKCNRCNHRFSKFVHHMRSAEDEDAPRCPECESVATMRLVSSFAVQGPTGADPQEVAANRAEAERAASITPKEQIDKWRGGNS